MPPLLNSRPSAPIIIPITVLIVILVAAALLLYRLIRRLIGCPHQKSKYPFDTSKHRRSHRSEIPTSPYTIDPSSASSNSLYFVKGGASPSTSGSAAAAAVAAGILYPALAISASAPSRTPSTGRPHDDSYDSQSFPLDAVDSNADSPSRSFPHVRFNHDNDDEDDNTTPLRREAVFEALLNDDDDHDDNNRMTSPTFGDQHIESDV